MELIKPDYRGGILGCHQCLAEGAWIKRSSPGGSAGERLAG